MMALWRKLKEAKKPKLNWKSLQEEIKCLYSCCERLTRRQVWAFDFRAQMPDLPYLGQTGHRTYTYWLRLLVQSWNKADSTNNFPCGSLKNKTILLLFGTMSNYLGPPPRMFCKTFFGRLVWVWWFWQQRTRALGLESREAWWKSHSALESHWFSKHNQKNVFVQERKSGTKIIFGSRINCARNDWQD